MKENNVKVGKLFMKNLKTGEMFEFEGLKEVNLDTTAAPEQHVLEQSVPDGINIHITGSEISRIGNIDICIYMKEEE